ncbi:MAG: hypothetical protein L6R38_004418 [Xanthoria sp. 2 TBL-2021]|nr:MAG: hypothetical protein L6R38_004418 [Xanthoria sp. 2 TBL-2021]
MRKDTPAPHAARRAQSPPRTPLAGSKRSSKHKTPRDIYFEGLTDHARAPDGDDAMRNQRISHDLSLTSNIGRNSVVDNMLLSLNPDQPKLESPPYTLPSRFTSSESPRSRGHQPSSSLNSDYCFPSPSSNTRPDSHRSNHLPRGRRSNSSNFQSLSRIDSLTTDEEKTDTRRARAYQSQRAGLAGRTSVPASRTGRKSSKSSGSSSVDFGHMMRQSALPRRSASFDDTHRRPSFSMSSSLSQPIIYHNIEAAPTPTVPSGPRSPVNLPSAPPQSVPSSSKRTFRNQNTRKSKNDGRKGSLGQKSENLEDTNHLPAPAFKAQRPESPVKEPLNPLNPQQRPPSQSRDHPKERPGFFRRVFMSSRNTSAGAHDPLPPPSQPQSSRNSVRIDNEAVAAPPRKLSKSGLSGEITHLPKEPAAPPLTKKPSSFFRRRKKSVSEPVPPPVLVPASGLQPPDATVKHNPSVSSLRELMNPYLSNSPDVRKGSTTGQHDTASRSQRIPVEKSTIKQVLPSSASHKSANKVEEREIESSTSGDALSAKAYANSDDNLLHPHDQSFLHDNSSNETRLIASDTSQIVVVETSSVEKPMSNQAKEDSPSEKDHEPAPFNDGSIQAAQPVVDFMQNTKGRKILGRKQSRSCKVSGDSHVVNKTNELSTPAARASPVKEIVTATLSPDEATPRVWLRPEKSIEDLRGLAETSSFGGDTQPSHPDDDRPTSSRRGRTVKTVFKAPASSAIDPTSPDFDVTLPFREDKVLAQRVFEGDETLVSKAKAAAWLGEAGPDRARVRRAYMELFNWQNLNILAALRDFCGRLLLKGETQQVDRILDAFSTQWCACNANHGFKATDVVHTICYSILLLNTDLHAAEIEQKMTRAQFIKNTLPTIRRVAADAAPDGFESKRASTMPTRNWAESPSGRSMSPTLPRESAEGRRSFEGRRPSYRLSSRPSDQAAQVLRLSQSPTPLDFETASDECGPLVKAPFHGKMSSWEVQVEMVLKDFFNSIRQQRLPIHSRQAAEPAPQANGSLSAMTSNMLRRTPSMLSKAGSEHMSYRGRSTEPRFGTGRWTSKTRSRPRLYPSSTVASSRTSLEDQSSAWTPSASSTWSKYSFGKTQTSMMSVDSFSSNLPSNDYQQSIGFANALSQAIIREEGVADPSEDMLKATPLLEDENLELAGAPWAKEGILKHKHHLEALGKKAKDRNWIESFAVIEKGWMRLFSFNMNAKSLRLKAKQQKAPGGVVGGGNWMDSAEDLGKYLLRQTIASALPPPGYSKTRPHVWALSLPNGAVHLFQVGTPEIVKEFVTTANYWSARLSKEPLVGGVSNVEYGWSDSVINLALIPQENRPPSNPGNARPSLQSSIRSSLDQGSVRPKLPGDRIVISDWTPPQQSMVASVLLEVDQLKALTTYVKNIEDELQKHNELRSPMLLAFSSRHPNSTKAMANWERKSSYLLREIVKFRTYIDCLQAAQAHKEVVYASKKALADEATETTGENAISDHLEATIRFDNEQDS